MRTALDSTARTGGGGGGGVGGVAARCGGGVGGVGGVAGRGGALALARSRWSPSSDFSMDCSSRSRSGGWRRRKSLRNFNSSAIFWCDVSRSKASLHLHRRKPHRATSNRSMSCPPLRSPIPKAKEQEKVVSTNQLIDRSEIRPQLEKKTTQSIRKSSYRKGTKERTLLVEFVTSSYEVKSDLIIHKRSINKGNDNDENDQKRTNIITKSSLLINHDLINKQSTMILVKINDDNRTKRRGNSELTTKGSI